MDQKIEEMESSQMALVFKIDGTPVMPTETLPDEAEEYLLQSLFLK